MPPVTLQDSAAPGTPLVFHTLHMPRLDADRRDGTLAHGTISRRAHVAQLNAAGRHLARRHGFEVSAAARMCVCYLLCMCGICGGGPPGCTADHREQLR